MNNLLTKDHGKRVIIVNLFIIDLEATCYKKNPPTHFFSEMIEIGGVVLDTKTNQVVDEYQSFVKPVLFPHLSTFCIELTSITQEQVDRGIPFQLAIQELKSVSKKHNALFCSWGHYDRKQIQRQCIRFQIGYPFSSSHLNLKEAHSQFYGIKRMGMKGAIYYHGLSLEGTHHRGIDDARNIAKVTQKMISEDWEWKDYVKKYPLHLA